MLEQQLRDYYQHLTAIDEDAVRRTRDTVLAPPRSTGRRSRHVVAAISAATVAVAAAAVTAVVAGGVGTGHTTTTSHAAATHRQPSHNPRPSTLSARPAQRTPLRPQQMKAVLTGLLPKDRSWDVTLTQANASHSYIVLQVDDGRGPAQVSLSLEYPTRGRPAAEQPQGCVDQQAGADGYHWPQGSCTAAANGSQTLALKSYEYPADPSRGGKEWYLERLWPSGVKLSIHEWNTPTEKDSRATRTDPPLSLSEMRQIASATAWQAT